MPLKLILASLLLALLMGCAGQVYEDPDLLARAREAAEAAPTVKPERISASIRPESAAVFSAMRGNIALVGLYRQYPDGSARFALSLPQGTRLGSAERKTDAETEFKTLSPSAVVSSLVRSAFQALDGISMLHAQSSDAWNLYQGERHTGVDQGVVVLVRQRQLGRGEYSNLVYDLQGKPLAFYQIAGGRLLWKMDFTDGNLSAFTFRDNRYDWILHVELVATGE